MRYALIRPDNTIDRFGENIDPTVQTKTGWKWLSAPRASVPSYDSAIQVLEGPTITVGETEVTESYNVRNKTTQELDADKDAKINSLEEIIFKILFNHENRIRTLAGQASVTQAQFRAAIKALL